MITYIYCELDGVTLRPPEANETGTTRKGSQ
jgi:hypothetical protein